MEFYAYHGCYDEEQLIGNNFIVDITIDIDMEKASNSDSLRDALNYAKVYELVKFEMFIKSRLLEHFSRRILDRLFECFPQMNWTEICVTKLNPPIGGKMQGVTVSLKRSRH